MEFNLESIGTIHLPAIEALLVLPCRCCCTTPVVPPANHRFISSRRRTFNSALIFFWADEETSWLRRIFITGESIQRHHWWIDPIHLLQADNIVIEVNISLSPSKSLLIIPWVSNNIVMVLLLASSVLL